MKRTFLALAAAAAILAGSATAAHAATVCETIPVPAVPAVYETVTTPAVTVTEHEFTHAQDGNGQGNGQGPANRWEAAGWNAESNPQSVGWLATGNTRVRVIDVERTTVTLVSPEIPASTVEQCTEMPDGQSPIKVDDPGVPLGNQDPVAAAPIVTPEIVQAPVPATIVEAPAPAAPVAATAPVQELAYTGAADWVFPAGLGLLGLGAATILSRRLIITK